MFLFFGGLGISAVYDGFGTVLVWYLEGETAAAEFFTAYTGTFKTIISLGVILGTALIVFYAQKDVPEMIERVFTEPLLAKTDYYTQKRYFLSWRKTMIFTAEVAFVAFIIFRCCQFPLKGTGDILMMIAVCAEYAFASFVGRKLRYTAMMVYSLSKVMIVRNLFKERELDDINWYMNIASTLTIIFVYIHVMFYYKAPFLYPFGQSFQIFLILPVIMATPVLLIFNFFPREVLRTLYRKSIDVEIKKLQKLLRNEALSTYEKRSYLIEFDKMSRDELRYSFQFLLTDLPIGITILAMLLQPLLNK